MSDVEVVDVVEVEKGSPVFAIVSFILGLISLLCGCCGFCCVSGWIGVFVSVTSIVLGIISLTKDEDSKGLAIAGIVCASIGLVILVASLLMSEEILQRAVNVMDSNEVENIFERIEEL